MTVSTPPDATPIAVAFPEAGKHLGYPNIDLNGPIQSGFSIPQGTQRRGARCSTSKAFLQSVRSRTNLHVVTFAYATKLVFNQQKRAVAVQFDRFSLSHLVYAKKEIILSAGTINSPQLLMLSGIGPKDHLQAMGIPVLANLPVGLNLQDHMYVLSSACSSFVPFEYAYRPLSKYRTFSFPYLFDTISRQQPQMDKRLK